MFAMLLEMTSTFSCCAAIPVVAMLKDCMLVSLRRRRAPVFRFGIAGQWPRRPVRAFVDRRPFGLVPASRFPLSGALHGSCPELDAGVLALVLSVAQRLHP